MATSKCMWIAFAVTFAMMASAVQPSAATRDVPEADQEGAGSSWPPAWRPRRPSFPPLPCIPGLPRLPWLPPCSNASSSSSPSGGGGATPSAPVDPTPQPAECRTSLSGLAPCADFLTNATSFSAPAAACCDGVKSLVKDAPVCLCHAMRGDLGKILPAHVLRLRVMALPRTCRVAVPFGTLRKCIRGPVPPMDAPPSAPPGA